MGKAQSSCCGHADWQRIAKWVKGEQGPAPLGHEGVRQTSREEGTSECQRDLASTEAGKGECGGCTVVSKVGAVLVPKGGEKKDKNTDLFWLQ